MGEKPRLFKKSRAFRPNFFNLIKGPSLATGMVNIMKTFLIFFFLVLFSFFSVGCSSTDVQKGAEGLKYANDGVSVASAGKILENFSGGDPTLMAAAAAAKNAGMNAAFHGSEVVRENMPKKAVEKAANIQKIFSR